MRPRRCSDAFANGSRRTALRCHRLRHFSAKQAVQAVPITEVMGRHGWTSYQTAMKHQRYTGPGTRKPLLRSIVAIELL